MGMQTSGYDGWQLSGGVGVGGTGVGVGVGVAVAVGVGVGAGVGVGVGVGVAVGVAVAVGAGSPVDVLPTGMAVAVGTDVSPRSPAEQATVKTATRTAAASASLIEPSLRHSVRRSAGNREAVGHQGIVTP